LNKRNSIKANENIKKLTFEVKYLSKWHPKKKS